MIFLVQKNSWTCMLNARRSLCSWKGQNMLSSRMKRSFLHCVTIAKFSPQMSCLSLLLALESWGLQIFRQTWGHNPPHPCYISVLTEFLHWSQKSFLNMVSKMLSITQNLFYQNYQENVKRYFWKLLRKIWILHIRWGVYYLFGFLVYKMDNLTRFIRQNICIMTMKLGNVYWNCLVNTKTVPRPRAKLV